MAQVTGLSIEEKYTPMLQTSQTIQRDLTPSLSDLFRSYLVQLYLSESTNVATMKPTLNVGYPEGGILRRAKAAKPDALDKWAHPPSDVFPELSNKSDEELNRELRRLRTD